MHRAAFIRWCARRVLQAIPVVIGVVVLTFTLIHIAPGDPIYFLAGDGGSAGYYADMRAKYGLDQPLPTQFVRYARALLTIDLGYSFMYQAPVSRVLRDYAPASIVLGSAGLALATLVGGLAGILSALTRSRVVDRAIRASASILYAAPVFWTGQMFILLLAVRAQWLPVAGMTSARVETSSVGRLADVGWHLVLPALTLSLAFGPVVMRVTRASVRSTARESFLSAATARGASRLRIITRHIVPYAAVPIIALVGQHATQLVAGAALTESLFGWPGLGYLVLHASVHRDYPLVIGAFLVISIGVVMLSAVADVLHAWMDPRVRLA